MSQPTRSRSRHLALVVATVTALVAGFLAGLVVGRTTTSLPDECAKALTAADAIVKAVDAEWETASGAVEAVQSAVDESGYRRLAADCRG